VGEAAVVIGVGNPDRGDDGVGPEVLAHLAGRVPGRVRLVHLAGADPAAIMDAWSGWERAVLVDAMVSGAAPGTVSRFDAAVGPLPAEVRLASTHVLGAEAAVEMARALGRLPARLVVYGVEGAAFGAGSGLTPAVAAAVAAATERILEEVRGA
jgi:hydrogenase maturation protease